MSAKAETIGAGVEIVKISADCDFVFCLLIRKLQPFEILQWAKESQWTKQRTSNSTSEIQIIFSLQ